MTKKKLGTPKLYLDETGNVTDEDAVKVRLLIRRYSENDFILIYIDYGSDPNKVKWDRIILIFFVRLIF